MHVTIKLEGQDPRHILANTSMRQLDLFRDLDIPALTNRRLAQLVA